MEKRLALEQKRKKWMNDRNQTLAGEESKLNNNNSNSNNNNRNNSRRSEERGNNNSSNSYSSNSKSNIKIKDELDENLVSQLTERITKEIRKEINIGLGANDLRDAMTEKMDKYLESELHTHLCKVCSNLMLSPNNTPMLLFPCGHTFCKMCCEKGNKQILSICPYCRHSVQSLTVNQTLKDLIDQFANQRQKVRNGTSDIFRSDSNSREISDPRAESRYKAKYEACKMRKEILINELHDEREKNLEKILRKKKSLKAAETHLLEERRAVEEKMKLLREELDLIDSHLNDQKAKVSELEELESQSRSSVALLEKSVADIEVEMEKLKILSTQSHS